MWNILAVRLEEANIYGYADQKQYGQCSQSIIPFSMMHRQTLLQLSEQEHHGATP